MAPPSTRIEIRSYASRVAFSVKVKRFDKVFTSILPLFYSDMFSKLMTINFAKKWLYIDI